MAKLLPVLLGCGVGAAVVGVGGYSLYRKGSQWSVEDDEEKEMFDNDEQHEEKPLVFESLEDFKNKGSENACLKDYLPSLNLNSDEGNEFSDANKPKDKTFFTDDNKKSTSPLQSCLYIEWKMSKKNGELTGKFVGLWTLVKGTEGFVEFNVAELTNDKKLKIDGLFYLVSNTSGKGSISFKKEVKNVDVAVAERDKYIPKANTNLPLIDKKSDGGFKTDISALEGKAKTYNNYSENKQLTGKITTASTVEQPLQNGTDNFEWGNKLFSLDSYWKLTEHLQDFKGTGTENK